MCVFITAEPSTKRCAWGRRIVEAGRPFFSDLDKKRAMRVGEEDSGGRETFFFPKKTRALGPELLDLNSLTVIYNP
jgi:hypothetical protein